MSGTCEYLWYIPNQNEPGHRGDVASSDHNSLEALTDQARALEEYGWKGALIGTGSGRTDTFTVASALASRTTTFENRASRSVLATATGAFRSAAATLDHLSDDRTLS